jgi:NTP pyrophosphatase (non-canonical NTP hydrolase)
MLCEKCGAWKNDPILLRRQNCRCEKIMKPEQKILYECALKHYGDENQKIKTMEECGELIQSLSKDLTGECIDRDKVLGELADVQIMIYQMGLLYGLENFERKVFEKSARLTIRIGKELVSKEHL